MKTEIHFRSYLAYFTFEWKTFQTKVAEKLQTRISYSFFFKKIVPFMR